MEPDEFQQQLDERRRREDEILSRVRMECSDFRIRNDEFAANFQLNMKRIQQELTYDRHQ